MNGRAIAFVLLSSLIMMAAIVLQNMFNPPTPPAEVAQQQPNIQTTTDEKNVDPTTATPTESPASDPTSGSPAASVNNGNELIRSQEESKPAENDTESIDSDAVPAPEDNTPEFSKDKTIIQPSDADDKFVTFGSLSADSNERYLITVNQRGGTIHRVELNFRQRKKGRFKYRDLEYEGGYLGSLDCIDTAAGCLVRTVGHGTPAQKATCPTTKGGIEVGDVLVSLDDEPITSAAELEERLAKKTHPRTEVKLKVNRDGTQLTFDVKLTNKPIELLRPEDGSRIDPDFDYPESFVLSLIKPSKFVDQAWPDLDRGMRTGLWSIEPDNSNGNKEITLSYDIPAANLAKHEFSGPLTVIKRYRLPEISDEKIHDLDSRTFHFDLDVEIENGSDQPQTIAYELDGPTGTPTETWWYANKIHGRSTAIGYVAGARDVLGSSEKQPFVFFGGPEIVKGALKNPPTVHYICSPLADNPASRNLNYVGVDTQYFNVSLIPEVGENEEFRCDSVTAFTNGGEIPEKNVREQKLVDVTFQMVKTVELEPNSSYKQTFEIFSGPKEPETLDHYGLDDAETFGWFAWCSKPLMWLLHFFYWITFSFSYGLAIIMLTVLVRSLMIPISRKAALNAQMMQHLQPQMKEIADKYKDDMEKRAAAQRELFKNHNYNPLSGCFMMFFQLPVFIGLYRGLSVDIALRDQPLIPGLNWCSNLSGPDQLLYWKDWMPSMLADETGWLGPYLNILPLATMVLFLVQQKMFMPPATDDQQKMMQKMMTFMMIFMGVMFFKVSAGLCIYFITSSIWGILERKLLPKPVLNTDKLPSTGTSTPAAVKTTKAASKAEEKAALKREVELADRKRRNAERAKRLKERGV